MTAILLVLCSAAACAAGGGPELVIEPGRPFSLQVGASARTADAALRIGFEAVAADSRCRKGEQCVWAGDATVRLWLQRAGGARQRFELHTAASAARGGSTPEPGLRVERLDPAPVAGTAIAQRNYVVTLVVDPAR